jgi:hypothetical protein
VSRRVTQAAKFGQLPTFDFSIYQYVAAWQMACGRGVACTDGRCTAFMEEHMKSLSELAARYDEWANVKQVTAEEILAGLDSMAVEVRDERRWRADWMTAEAAELRARAAELRKIERRRSTDKVAPTFFQVLTLK